MRAAGGPIEGRLAILVLLRPTALGLGAEAGAGGLRAALPEDNVEPSCLVGDLLGDWILCKQ